MWKAGVNIKELVSGYLNSVKIAEEKVDSEVPKWPSWEMNNHEQVVEGKMAFSYFFTLDRVVSIRYFYTYL